MKREDIARIAHEVNRALCLALGDLSQPSWADAPDWQKKSALTGVALHVENPDAGVTDSHDSWLAEKERDGWVYGPVKDPAAKQHPCMVAFDALPVEQQAKDYIFRAVVHSLAAHLDEFTIAPDGSGGPVTSGFLQVLPLAPQSTTVTTTTSAPRCAVRLREPHGVTPRGLQCDTCGARSNGEPVTCKAE